MVQLSPIPQAASSNQSGRPIAAHAVETQATGAQATVPAFAQVFHDAANRNSGGVAIGAQPQKGNSRHTDSQTKAGPQQPVATLLGFTAVPASHVVASAVSLSLAPASLANSSGDAITVLPPAPNVLATNLPATLARDVTNQVPAATSLPGPAEGLTMSSSSANGSQTVQVAATVSLAANLQSNYPGAPVPAEQPSAPVDAAPAERSGADSIATPFAGSANLAPFAATSLPPRASSNESQAIERILPEILTNHPSSLADLTPSANSLQEGTGPGAISNSPSALVPQQANAPAKAGSALEKVLQVNPFNTAAVSTNNLSAVAAEGIQAPASGNGEAARTTSALDQTVPNHLGGPQLTHNSFNSLNLPLPAQSAAAQTVLPINQLRTTPSAASMEHASIVPPPPGTGANGSRSSQDSGANKNPNAPESSVGNAPSSSPANGAVGTLASPFNLILKTATGAETSANVPAATAVPAPPAPSTALKDSSNVLTSSAATQDPTDPTTTQLGQDGRPQIVNAAQLTQNVAHSEMRISMQTDRLGPIELRAHVTGDAVGAAISVEKRDAHTALALELPALQQALSDKQMRVEQISLSHQAAGSLSADGRSQTSHEQRGSSDSRRSVTYAVSDLKISSSESSACGEQFSTFDSTGRLSVLA